MPSDSDEDVVAASTTNTDSTSLRPKRIRTSKPKVKTGCNNCKYAVTTKQVRLE